MDSVSGNASKEPQSLNAKVAGSSERIDKQVKPADDTQEVISMAEKNNFSSNTGETQKRKQRQDSNEHFKKRKCIVKHSDRNFEGKVEKLSEDSMSEEEKEVFTLIVSRLPFQWTCDQITEFIKEHCIEVYALEQLEGGDLESGQTIRLLFLNFEKCNQARKQLKLKSVEGRKLSVAFGVPDDTDSDAESEKTLLLVKRESKNSLSSSWRPDLDVWLSDPTGTYGLKSEYLDSLGITPPIDKWVHVSNFRCDKSELKEVLELAGQVVICAVVSVTNKYAKVMYSHPLEAVQAVSMLNGQIYYGQVLKVSMYKCPNNEMILPKGLVKVGPGLGKHGRPLRDVVKHYERHLSGKTCSIDDGIFMETFDFSGLRYTPNSATESTDNVMSGDTNLNLDVQTNNERVIDVSQQYGSNVKGFGEQTVAVAVNSPPRQQQQSYRRTLPSPSRSVSQPFPNGPIANHGSVLRSGLEGPNTGYQQLNGVASVSNVSLRGPVPRFAGPINPRFSGPVPRPSGPRFDPNTGVAPRGPRPNVCQTSANTWTNNCGPNFSNSAAPAQMHNVCAPQQENKGNSSIVELSNLPLSTTFAVLSSKLSLVGRLVSVALTRTGCAIARFATPDDAMRCYQHFNKMCAMGKYIEVKFI